MVAALGCVLGARRLYRLLNVGGVSRHALPFRALPVTVLFTRTVRRFAPQLVRPQATVVVQLAWSPAFLILWAPGGFRFTCYYYRGAYYKAFWSDPPSCAVGEPRKTYRGEHLFPLIFQNIHRYFLYLALLFLVFLSYDVWKALWFLDPATGTETFGVGVGTIVLALNVVFLGSYTFGCHSLRHLVGGRLDLLSKAPVRRTAYRCVGCFNRRHMIYAWMSLTWVGFCDIYVRLCSMGIWTDWRIF